MSLLRFNQGLSCVAALLAASACSNSSDPSQQNNVTSGGTSATGVSGQPGTVGGSGSGGTGSGTVTQGGGGTVATGGASNAGAGGSTANTTGGASNAGAGGSTAITTGGASNAGAGGTGQTSSNPAYAPDPRPINVTGTDQYSASIDGQPIYLDHSKPALGKLVLFLGGIGGGPGGGGIESFVHQYGFHCFSPKTNTSLTGGSVPDTYASNDPNDTEANRQVADARMELWDGVDRVDWNTPPQDILSETIAGIQQAQIDDPTGDWGFFLDDQGKLRTGDVWVVGYSWGSQTWAMISAYVPFGRVITTSGPQDEGFPYAGWITNPSPDGTPGDRKYLLVGLKNPYEMMDPGDEHELGMVTTVVAAGWTPGVTDVLPTSPGPYMDPQRLFAMIGGDGGTTPPGHTVFCNDNPANGWKPLCQFVFGQQP